jgi:hypothetical protein
MRNSLTYIFLFVLIGLMPICSKAQARSQAEEYNLKAAFVYNFTKFIEWTPSNNDDEFVICVLGYSPIIKALTEIAQSKSVNGKKIVIKQHYKPEDIKFCHILFIPRNSSYPLSEILTRVSHGTLTISEEDGYAAQGTALNFVVINNKLKFESNIRAIDEAGLKASSELLKLKLAIIVD